MKDLTFIFLTLLCNADWSPFLNQLKNKQLQTYNIIIAKSVKYFFFCE